MNDATLTIFHNPLLTRDLAPCLADRRSERRDGAEELLKRVNQHLV